MTAVALLICGVLINTLALVPGAREEMSIAIVFFWLWMVSPYAVGAGLLWIAEKPTVAAGWLAIPAIVDLGMFDSVFLHPDGSGGWGYLFSPLANLLFFGPTGALMGREIVLRSRK